MDNHANEVLFKQVFDAIPVGLVLIKKDHSIYAWNTWMAKHTHIEVSKAIGQRLETLYAEKISFRFSCALEQVLHYAHPQILSGILNKFIIPIPLDKNTYFDLDLMQQNVQILPVTHENENMALLVIQDISARKHLENTLMSMATKYEKSSLVDALTGLYNRRHLWKHLENTLKTAKREQFNVICCIYDIDFFKKINDEFGHSAGDEVLVSFAKIASATLRPNDLLFRYGGEEFITISTHIDIDNATILPNRLRETLAGTKVHGSVNKIITCSGGVSCWQPGTPYISSEMLVAKADVALYEAKSMGRNCVVLA